MLDGAYLDASSLSSALGSGKTRRLSNLEYRRSVQDVLEYQFSRQANPPQAWEYFTYSNGIQGALNSLPGDALATKLGSDQLSTNLSSARVDAYINTAYAVGKQIAGNLGHLKRFAGQCVTSATDVSSQTCVETFLTEFGTLAFRTPPTKSEIAELKSNAPDWKTLIAKILAHPRFLLHIERDGARASNGAYALTDYEIEARLAAVFWKSVPDVQGLNVAASGTLKTPAGLQAEIQRLLNSQRAKDTMWSFYQQWLGASRLPINGYSSGAGYDAFAAPISSSVLNNNFRDAVLLDGRQFLEYLTWEQPAKLEDVFKSPLIFTTDSTLASIYGVSPRANAAAAPVVDASGHYKGLLTRALITQQKPSPNGDINHIQRGVFILTNLLARELGQPANFADQQQAGLSIPITSSTRFETNAKTGIGSCVGCHTQINPPGFALGNYDSLGRYVTTERRYRSDTGTTPVATNSVDANTNVFLNGTNYALSDADSLQNAILQSGAVYQGFAEYYFRFVFGRVPKSGPDRALVETLISGLKTKTIREALASLAQSKEFALAQTADL